MYLAGFVADAQGEYKSRAAIHMDAFRSFFCNSFSINLTVIKALKTIALFLTVLVYIVYHRWVKRDSYLPVGSQNLKATTKVGIYNLLLCSIVLIEN